MSYPPVALTPKTHRKAQGRGVQADAFDNEEVASRYKALIKAVSQNVRPAALVADRITLTRPTPGCRN